MDGLFATDPVRHQDRLTADVFEAVGLHLGEDPVDGQFQAGRPTVAVPKTVDQLGQAIVGRTVPQGRLDETVGVMTT